MKETVVYLEKRRFFMIGIVVFLGIFALVVSFNLQVTPSIYFGGMYNTYFLFFLIFYKLIELPILYYLLFHRHVKYLQYNSLEEEILLKIKKHSKLLLFLIPQGNTIFGIIAYKLSGNIVYFLLFSSIALITLFLVKPKKLL